MKSIKEHRQFWQPYWSNHVFGIVGHSTLIRKPPLWRALRLMKQIQSRRTQPVQFVWSLSFNIWVPHNSRGKSNTPLQCGWGVQENLRERDRKKKRLYSRIQLMLKAPQLHLINIGWFLEVLTEIEHFFLYWFLVELDLALGDTAVTKGRNKTLNTTEELHLYRSSLLSWEDDGVKTHC